MQMWPWSGQPSGSTLRFGGFHAFWLDLTLQTCQSSARFDPTHRLGLPAMRRNDQGGFVSSLPALTLSRTRLKGEIDDFQL
jgi:hypothetical protein